MNINNLGKCRIWDKINDCWFDNKLLRLSVSIDGDYVYSAAMGGDLEEGSYEISWFTGLPDINDKPIWQYDIVLATFNSRITPEKLIVVYGGKYNYAAFGLSGKRQDGVYGTNPTWDTLNPLYCRDLEVIGNRFENPGLMEGIF